MRNRSKVRGCGHPGLQGGLEQPAGSPVAAFPGAPHSAPSPHPGRWELSKSQRASPPNPLSVASLDLSMFISKMGTLPSPELHCWFSTGWIAVGGGGTAGSTIATSQPPRRWCGCRHGTLTRPPCVAPAYLASPAFSSFFLCLTLQTPDIQRPTKDPAAGPARWGLPTGEQALGRCRWAETGAPLWP